MTDKPQGRGMPDLNPKDVAFVTIQHRSGDWGETWLLWDHGAQKWKECKNLIKLGPMMIIPG